MPDMDAVSGVFKALGDPLRLQILRLLPDADCACKVYNVSGLAEKLNVPQPTVSHHLRTLKQAGVVKCRKTCRDVYYWIDRAALQASVDALAGEIIPSDDHR